MTLENANPKILEYETSRLDIAIENISKLVEKYASKPAQFEYYLTMQECLLGLGAALAECELIYMEQRKILNRIEVMEHLLAKHLKEKTNAPLSL